MWLVFGRDDAQKDGFSLAEQIRKTDLTPAIYFPDSKKSNRRCG